IRPPVGFLPPSDCRTTVVPLDLAKSLSALGFAVVADGSDGSDGCTVLLSGCTEPGALVMLITRGRAFLSGNTMLIPILRRLGAARRRRPLNALGVSGHDLDLVMRSPTMSARAFINNFLAVPVHSDCSFIMVRTASATRSASITPSTA